MKWICKIWFEIRFFQNNFFWNLNFYKSIVFCHCDNLICERKMKNVNDETIEKKWWKIKCEKKKFLFKFDFILFHFSIWKKKKKHDFHIMYWTFVIFIIDDFKIVYRNHFFNQTSSQICQNHEFIETIVSKNVWIFRIKNSQKHCSKIKNSNFSKKRSMI